MASGKSWFERLWSEERRRADRKTSLPLAAYYWDGAVPAPRQVRDISPEGMYLLTEQRWYPNTLVTMTLVRSDKPESDPERALRLTARVVRAGTDGVGLAFVLPTSNRAGDEQGSFTTGANRKDLIEFLARLQSDTGRTIIKFASLSSLDKIQVENVAPPALWLRLISRSKMRLRTTMRVLFQE
jgi:hypothetical protein